MDGQFGDERERADVRMNDRSMGAMSASGGASDMKTQIQPELKRDASSHAVDQQKGDEDTLDPTKPYWGFELLECPADDEFDRVDQTSITLQSEYPPSAALPLNCTAAVPEGASPISSAMASSLSNTSIGNSYDPAPNRNNSLHHANLGPAAFIGPQLSGDAAPNLAAPKHFLPRAVRLKRAAGPIQTPHGQKEIIPVQGASVPSSSDSVIVPPPIATKYSKPNPHATSSNPSMLNALNLVSTPIFHASGSPKHSTRRFDLLTHSEQPEVTHIVLIGPIIPESIGPLDRTPSINQTNTMVRIKTEQGSTEAVGAFVNATESGASGSHSDDATPIIHTPPLYSGPCTSTLAIVSPKRADDSSPIDGLLEMTQYRGAAPPSRCAHFLPRSVILGILRPDGPTARATTTSRNNAKGDSAASKDSDNPATVEEIVAALVHELITAVHKSSRHPSSGFSRFGLTRPAPYDEEPWESPDSSFNDPYPSPLGSPKLSHYDGLCSCECMPHACTLEEILLRGILKDSLPAERPIPDWLTPLSIILPPSKIRGILDLYEGRKPDYGNESQHREIARFRPVPFYGKLAVLTNYQQKLQKGFERQQSLRDCEMIHKHARGLHLLRKIGAEKNPPRQLSASESEGKSEESALVQCIVCPRVHVNDDYALLIPCGHKVPHTCMVQRWIDAPTVQNLCFVCWEKVTSIRLNTVNWRASVCRPPPPRFYVDSETIDEKMRGMVFQQETCRLWTYNVKRRCWQRWGPVVLELRRDTVCDMWGARWATGHSYLVCYRSGSDVPAVDYCLYPTNDATRVPEKKSILISDGTRHLAQITFAGEDAEVRLISICRTLKWLINVARNRASERDAIRQRMAVDDRAKQEREDTVSRVMSSGMADGAGERARVQVHRVKITRVKPDEPKKGGERAIDEAAIVAEIVKAMVDHAVKAEETKKGGGEGPAIDNLWIESPPGSPAVELNDGEGTGENMVVSPSVYDYVQSGDGNSLAADEDKSGVRIMGETIDQPQAKRAEQVGVKRKKEETKKAKKEVKHEKKMVIGTEKATKKPAIRASAQAAATISNALPAKTEKKEDNEKHSKKGTASPTGDDKGDLGGPDDASIGMDDKRDHMNDDTLGSEGNGQQGGDDDATPPDTSNRPLSAQAGTGEKKERQEYLSTKKPQADYKRDLTGIVDRITEGGEDSVDPPKGRLAIGDDTKCVDGQEESQQDMTKAAVSIRSTRQQRATAAKDKKGDIVKETVLAPTVLDVAIGGGVRVANGREKKGGDDVVTAPSRHTRKHSRQAANGVEVESREKSPPRSTPEPADDTAGADIESEETVVNGDKTGAALGRQNGTTIAAATKRPQRAAAARANKRFAVRKHHRLGSPDQGNHGDSSVGDNEHQEEKKGEEEDETPPTRQHTQSAAVPVKVVKKRPGKRGASSQAAAAAAGPSTAAAAAASPPAAKRSMPDTESSDRAKQRMDRVMAAAAGKKARQMPGREAFFHLVDEQVVHLAKIKYNPEMPNREIVSRLKKLCNIDMQQTNMRSATSLAQIDSEIRGDVITGIKNVSGLIKVERASDLEKLSRACPEELREFCLLLAAHPQPLPRDAVSSEIGIWAKTIGATAVPSMKYSAVWMREHKKKRMEEEEEKDEENEDEEVKKDKKEEEIEDEEEEEDHDDQC